MKALRYFTDKDFAAPNCRPACKLSDMDGEFMEGIDNARHISGEKAKEMGLRIVYRVTSAYRPVEHELSRKRSGKGDHPQRKGIDISFANNMEKWLILYGLFHAGFTRIGINDEKNFIHVGAGEGLPSPTCFPYE